MITHNLPFEHEIRPTFLNILRYINKYAGPKVIQLFPCRTQLSMEFIMLINVKMPIIIIGS